ncbi:hypothetical protein KKB44_02095 [Candidatus Micrarchaeota archaeon]|nr:hypothetical protein [Candidatus Micrarchaeota archaeon]
MKLLNIVIGLLIILMLLLGGVVAFLLLSIEPEDILPETSPSVFSIIEIGTAADNAYTVFNYRGEGNITLVGLRSEPYKRVTILNDSQAIQATKFQQLVDDIKTLEKYGYEVVVTNTTTIGDELYVIPTGAIPASTLFSLQQNTSNGTVIYIGERDLILSRGIKQQAWYNSLSQGQAERIVQYDGTLDDFIDDGSISLAQEILMMTWTRNSNSTTALSGNGITTAVLPIENNNYLRIIYEIDDLYGIHDSEPLTLTEDVVNPEPQEVFPWQKATLFFSLNKTNGTAFLSIKKDGKEIKRDLLRRVTDENVFLEKLQYEEPGSYIISVDDNSGTVATGYLHVKDLDISIVERSGTSYLFSVTIDGEPVQNTDVYISLGDSEQKKKYFVTDGSLVINAKLDPGINTFNIDILGTTIPLEYENRQENLFDFYIKYGIPGLLVIVIVYFGARISKRPTYRLRFGDGVALIRQEIRIPTASALESFRKIRRDMNLGSTPITPQEFSISLKRYLTNGADITEGNVDEILKKLVKVGHLENYRDYYQLSGEGNVKKNALCRMIREKLIQNGTMFDERAGKFVTKDCEIGFFGQRFTKKGIIIVEDKAEARRIISHLNDDETAKLEIMQANDMVEFVAIDRLEDVL